MMNYHKYEFEILNLYTNKQTFSLMMNCNIQITICLVKNTLDLHHFGCLSIIIATFLGYNFNLMTICKTKREKKRVIILYIKKKKLHLFAKRNKGKQKKIYNVTTMLENNIIFCSNKKNNFPHTISCLKFQEITTKKMIHPNSTSTNIMGMGLAPKSSSSPIYTWVFQNQLVSNSFTNP